MALVQLDIGRDAHLAWHRAKD